MATDEARCAPAGPSLDGERAALDLVGDAFGRTSPAARLCGTSSTLRAAG
ncbi:hypothetical protein [Streptomyces sp. V4I2]|nr:hypothetical protein [Streptomyces sp. V4I2]MDQ1050623.1 hypothetical protein [Streptomyces sp. V4I2]